jgi:replication fork clamp-binding protein CrfC
LGGVARIAARFLKIMKIADIYQTTLDADFTRFSTAYQEAVNEFEKSCDEMAEARFNYDVTRADAYTNVTGTVPEREAKVLQVCRHEYQSLLKAEGKHDFLKAKLRMLDKQLSVLQSKAANEREQASFSRLPEPR